MKSVGTKVGNPGRWVRGLRGRLRALSPRQAAGFAVASLLTAAIAMAAIARLSSLALLLVGFMNLLVFAAVVQLRRRVGQEVRSLKLENAQLVKRVEASQRRILAAIENERLAAAERQHALLDALDKGRDMANST